MSASSPTAPPHLEYEHRLIEQGFRLIAGVDEVGRGSWAGPLVAAAVVLPLDDPELGPDLAGVRDSKTLSAAQRRALDSTVRAKALGIGLSFVSHRVIDRRGIAAANREALRRAVSALPLRPHAVLIDHFALPRSRVHHVAVPHGDACSLSIAAASVVAKVARDAWMEGCDARFPEYGFGRHKGYGTAQHRDVLRARGPCALHRRSFRPVAECRP